MQREEVVQGSSLVGSCLAGQRRNNTVRQNESTDNVRLGLKGRSVQMRSAVANASSPPEHWGQKQSQISHLLT